jgi:AraC-like DNA-binding protein
VGHDDHGSVHVLDDLVEQRDPGRQAGLVAAERRDGPRVTMSDPLLRPYAQQFLKSMPSPRGATVTDRVRELVDVLLPLGRCSTAQVARNLGVTPRTLHRQLAAEGQTFSSVVDDIRAALAERYLANDRYSLTDVSQLLGFMAPSAFSRWFRGRFHATPTEWRHTARRPSLVPAPAAGPG